MVGLSDEAGKRLTREAEVVRKLDHPNIVPLLDVFDGNLVYGYVAGSDLGALLKSGPLPPRRAARLVGDILQALSHAHLQGVLHLDVKPDNVLLKGDSALLTDFGFAKDLAQTAITGDQELLGTPNFMAPEQFQGVRTDSRSDIYGAGAVLYHALTGQPPFGTQVFRWLTGDDRLTLEPLPAAAEALAPVVECALARQPEARYPNADAMLTALRHATAALPG
jgi:serine/threonine protein kinase